MGVAKPPDRTADRRAQLLLGGVVALVMVTFGDAVLLPHVDRAAARAWGPLVTAAWLSLGWWIGSHRRWTRMAVVGTGLTVGLGGCLAAGLLPAAHGRLVEAILGERVAYHAAVVGWLCLAAAPVAFPLGLLLGPGLGVGGQKELTLFFLGGAVGAALAPWLGEVLLGRGDTVRAAAVLAAATGPLLGTGKPDPPRLVRGAATALLAVGVAAAVAYRLLVPIVDLGTNTASWWVALACLGAAVGCLLPLRPRPLPIDAVLALALPLALASGPVVRGLRAPAFAADSAWNSWLPWPGALQPHLSLLAETARLAFIALPFGFLVGRLIASRGDGRPLPWTLGLLTAAAPFTLLLLLPRLGVLGTLGVAAVPVVAVALLSPPRPSVLRFVVVAAVAAGISLLRVPDGPGGLLPEATWQLADGLASRVVNPDSGRRVLAVDGRAPVGRHPLQEHRLVHLPFLWAGEPRRTLLVATDLGEAERALLEHDPAHVDWLRPFPVPTVDEQGSSPSRRRFQGNERLFLSQDGEAWLYDLVLMLPDPRVRRRAPLLATVEFYREVLARLAPDGLFCQWWDLASIDVSDLKAVIASAAHVFPATYVVIDHPRARRGQLGIVGRTRPLLLSIDALNLSFASNPVVRDELSQVGLNTLGVASLVSQHEGLLDLLASAEDRVSDERSALGARGGMRELAQPLSLYTALDTFGRRRCDPMAWIASDPDRPGLPVHTRDVLAGWQHLLGAAQAVVLEQGADVQAFEREPPGSSPEVEGRAHLQALVSLPDWHYLQDQVVAFAIRLEAEGRAAEAEQYLRHAVALDESSPRLRFELAGVVERAGDLDDARVLYNTVLAFAPDHPGALAALDRLGDD